MKKRIFNITLALVLIASFVTPALASGEATLQAAPQAAPRGNKAIFFASDGMRPDLMERYAAEGGMPTYAALMAEGVRGDNGMVQAFPPNTGVGWYTMATGTYPS